MPATIGYHVVKSAHGQWLPGDQRGHWSTAWDEQIGYIEPHMLHPGDPVRRRMADERLAHPPVLLTRFQIEVVVETLHDCVIKSAGDLSFAALAILPTHMHMVIPYSGRDVDRTAKWIADQTTKQMHARTGRDGPVWCKGKWRGFVYETEHWYNTIRYVEAHNTQRGLPGRPYVFVRGG